MSDEALEFSNPLSWITEAIAIGKALDLEDLALMRRCGFRSILSLDGSCSPGDARRLGVERVIAYDLLDGPGNSRDLFERVVRDLGRLVEQQGPVLVQCHAGRSRSPAVVAAYLAERNAMPVDAAIQVIESVRPINIQPALRELVDAHGAARA